MSSLPSNQAKPSWDIATAPAAVDRTATAATSQSESSPIVCQPSQPTVNHRRRSGWLLGDTLMRWTDALTASHVDVTRSGDVRDLSNYECFHSWIEWLYEEPPSFVFIQMASSMLKNGTRVDKRAAGHLRGMVETCSRLGVAVFMVGSTTLQSWNVPEIRKLRPHLQESYVRWCNLNVTHDDGALSSVMTRVWCNLMGMPNLSECKHNSERHAVDGGSDREKQHNECSPARYARSFAFSVAFSKSITQFMDKALEPGGASP